MVCVVDDAQWPDRDSLQVLVFVARRLRAESVAMVFAVRDQPETQELAGLAELVVTGLPETDARALLGSAIRGPVDKRVLDRLVAEARGNPLYSFTVVEHAPRRIHMLDVTANRPPPGWPSKPVT